MFPMMREKMEHIRREELRNVWVVGIAKRTQALEHFRLGLSLARVLKTGRPCFVPVPYRMQQRAYKWEEYIRSPDDIAGGGEDPKFNAGSMHFVRFGSPHRGSGVDGRRAAPPGRRPAHLRLPARTRSSDSRCPSTR